MGQSGRWPRENARDSRGLAGDSLPPRTGNLQEQKQGLARAERGIVCGECPPKTPQTPLQDSGPRSGSHPPLFCRCWHSSEWTGRTPGLRTCPTMDRMCLARAGIVVKRSRLSVPAHGSRREDAGSSAARQTAARSSSGVGHVAGRGRRALPVRGDAVRSSRCRVPFEVAHRGGRCRRRDLRSSARVRRRRVLSHAPPGATQRRLTTPNATSGRPSGPIRGPDCAIEPVRIVPSNPSSQTSSCATTRKVLLDIVVGQTSPPPGLKDLLDLSGQVVWHDRMASIVVPNVAAPCSFPWSRLSCPLRPRVEPVAAGKPGGRAPRVAPCGVTSSERTGGMARFGQVLWHRSGRGAGGGAIVGHSRSRGARDRES